MRIIQIIFILCVLNAFGQERKINSTMKVVEEYTIDSYSCPDSILFYVGQEVETDNKFKQFFERINRKFKDRNVIVNTFFDDDLNSSTEIKTFEDLKYDKSNIESRYVCILGLGDCTLSADGINKGRNIVIDKEALYWVYDLYIMLIDTETDKIMVKRKLNVKGEDLLDKGNNRLVKILGRELKIIK
ncbi:hypothetical protein OAE07_01530 [Winogradskyella sp.]|nr:hypothetical protein [Winogradskyella sp.]MDC1505053.1 hypothetical protein [Winogradskyella sp.]